MPFPASQAAAVRLPIENVQGSFPFLRTKKDRKTGLFFILCSDQNPGTSAPLQVSMMN